MIILKCFIDMPSILPQNWENLQKIHTTQKCKINRWESQKNENITQMYEIMYLLMLEVSNKFVYKFLAANRLKTYSITRFMVRNTTCARFSNTCMKIGTIQGILAWPCTKMMCKFMKHSTLLKKCNFSLCWDQ